MVLVLVVTTTTTVKALRVSVNASRIAKVEDPRRPASRSPIFHGTYSGSFGVLFLLLSAEVGNFSRLSIFVRNCEFGRKVGGDLPLAGVGSDDLAGGNLLPRKWSLLSGGHLNHKGKERKMWQPDGGGGGCSSRTWCTHKHKRPRGGHRRFCRKTNALFADWPRRSRKIRQSSFSSPKTKFAPSPVRESLSLFSPICTTVCV